MENQRLYDFIIKDDGTMYIVIENYGYENESYSLYKVGTGFVITDFNFVGDLEEDFFTFLNESYYGLMDYDLNILCHYSVYDNMEYED